MLADASGVMPEALKFEGDKTFFTAALDRADLIVHGKHSHEGQPNSPLRRRIVLTRKISGVADDPSSPKTTLWNPTGAPFETACAHAGVGAGTIAIIGGPSVFDMFMDRYDTFWLSQAPNVRLPDGEPVFSGVPQRTPQQVLASHGLNPGPSQLLDANHSVTVTPWLRTTP
ncbi:MAG TPA: dihydrofolate reductase [Bradyrhizobium sp.]|uniref:dihydrofolate reductase n=1 Tax=Bradyrhizobium sp. TaxID=376 RepID=UPI002D7EA4A2|nr:dihydrofolate reductase [Bradyrhizobium sp.]HET7888697.1 dihydrofolate reductase [Bradyrhizobium sp.]